MTTEQDEEDKYKGEKGGRSSVQISKNINERPQRNSAEPLKVVFLSKAQREKLKEQKKNDEEYNERRKRDTQNRKRRDFVFSDERDRISRRERAEEERREAREAKRRKEMEDFSSNKGAVERANSTSDTTTNGNNGVESSEVSPESHLTDLKLLQVDDAANPTKQNRSVDQRELEQLREHYLGIRKEKKKIQKPSEKFRNIFNFEWDASEDTARGDHNPLYLNRREPQLLFGRGFRAGVDIREQRRHNNFYDELVRRRVAILEKDDAGEMASKGIIIPRDRSQLLRQRDIETNDPCRVHWSDKKKDEMTDRDWRIFREDFEIYIKGGRVPAPMRKWSESGLPPELLEAVHQAGYVRPTPIQMQAIPIALEQRDLIGIAETGSGKTAAFVLPMLSYVRSLPALDDETSQDGAYALVLAPSRELAIQIDEETRKFASFSKCRAVAVVGGRNAEQQAFELRRGCEVVIGTPGRVKDCLEKAYTVLNQCNYIVLDEADRMIDMGFEEIVNWILDQIPSTNLKSEDEDTLYQQELEAKAGHRQYRLTHMFSATMPVAVERLARKYLRSPAYISIGDPGAGKRAIEQHLEFMAEPKKKQRLQEILQSAEPPVMVFTNQKKVADVLAKALQKLNFRAASLHGGKTQEMRESSLQGFKDGEFDILVATDVAGRGIDIEGVQLVVNYDMPKDIESYTHRIGRTGRAGKKGRAVSFVTEEDNALFYDLKLLLQSTNNIVPMELAQHPASKVKPGTVTQKRGGGGAAGGELPRG